MKLLAEPWPKSPLHCGPELVWPSKSTRQKDQKRGRIQSALKGSMSARKWIRSYLSLAAVLTLLCWSGSRLPAQIEAGQITGAVFNPARTGVAGVEVVASEMETKNIRTSKSSSDGKYVMPNLAAGTYLLTATTPGFEIFHQRVSVVAGSRVRVDIHLTAASR
jgi:hypothetical protein